jgi:siroheme synthase-like protein
LGWLSLNIDFSERHVLLVGAGRVGRRKLKDLLSAGAWVRVVEPKDDPYLTDLADKGIIVLEKEFQESFLNSVSWVFVAIDQAAQATHIASLARSKGLMVNVADRPEDCNFIMPALVCDPPFRLTVSTEGNSPALSAVVAKKLRNQFAGYGALASLLGQIRPLVVNSDLDQDKRRAIFMALAEDKSLVDFLSQGNYPAVKECLKRHLAPLELPTFFFKSRS